MSKRVLASIVAIAIVACATFGGLCLLHSADETGDVSEDIAESEPIEVKNITSASLRVMFAGTTFWGRRTNTMARASVLGVKYPFSKLDTLNRGDYDAWIAGLECPITDNGHNTQEEESIFKFNCDPDYLEEAQNYFTAFLLGNNHTDNQGEEGFAKTKEYLSKYGIQYFGSYDYTDGETNCGIVVLPLNVTFDNGEMAKYSLPMGFCSAHGVYGIPTEAVLQNMKKYAEYVPTVAMPHMGAEYQSENDTIRQNLYRKMIDYGVEAVIADHPHWIQNTEAYEGKLIVYSMGNFMFDQMASVETSRSAAIDAKISVKNASKANLEAWNELGEQCLSDNDTCFEKIQSAGLEKLSLEWTFDYHGTTSAGDRITRLASDSEQEAIGDRLRWTATLKGLTRE